MINLWTAIVLVVLIVSIGVVIGEFLHVRHDLKIKEMQYERERKKELNDEL